MKMRRELVLSLIVLLGLGVRLLWWSSIAAVVENEGVEYASLAENLFSGMGYTDIFGGRHVFFPPMYPILIGLGSFVFGDFEDSARLVSLLAGLGLIIASWYVGRRLFGDRVGLIAALLVSLHPTMVALSVSTYSEMLYLFVAILGIILCLHAQERKSWVIAAIAGAVWGLAYLVRPEGLVIGGIFVIMVAASGFFIHRKFARSVGTALAGGLALVIVAAPYIFDLSQKAEQFRWEGKSGVNAMISERLRQGMPYGEAARGLKENGEIAGPMLRLGDQTWMLRHNSAGVLSMSSGLLSNPLGSVRSILISLVVAGYLTSPWIFIFVLLGVGATGWWRSRLWYGIFVAMFGAMSLLVAMTTDVRFSRFLFPLLPIVLIWASGGIDFAAKRLAEVSNRILTISQRNIHRIFSVAICLGLCLATVGPTLALGEFSQAKRISVRTTGERIDADFRNTLSDGRKRPVIAGFGLAPTYYARGIHRYLAFAPEDLAIGYLHKVSPDYVVLQNTETNQAPYVESWFEDGIPDDCAVDMPGTDGSDTGSEIRLWKWDCRTLQSDD